MAKRKEKIYYLIRLCEKWRDLIHALHREDRELLLNIYSYRYRYDSNYSFTNCSKDSKLDSFSIYLFHHTSGHQKKIIKEIKGET